MCTDILASALTPATKAATTPAGLGAAIRYPSLEAAPAGREALYLPRTSSVGQACWIPAGNKQEVQSVLDEIILDRALVTQRQTVPLGFEALKELAAARTEYIDGIAAVRARWEEGGKVVTPEVAEAVSQWRDTFRASIRQKYPASGFAAKMFEVSTDVALALRTGDLATRASRVDARREAMIGSGQSEKLLESALRTNAQADQLASFARSRIPVARALAVGGTVVTAVEIPYRAYKLYNAKTDAETQEALAKLIDASAAGAIGAACLVMGITTGGVGFLACGVAPVAAGIFAGDAAIAIHGLLK